MSTSLDFMCEMSNPEECVGDVILTSNMDKMVNINEVQVDSNADSKTSSYLSLVRIVNI